METRETVGLIDGIATNDNVTDVVEAQAQATEAAAHTVLWKEVAVVEGQVRAIPGPVLSRR